MEISYANLRLGINNMQTVVVCQKGTNEVIACVPLDGSECIVRKDVEIKVYNGT